MTTHKVHTNVSALTFAILLAVPGAAQVSTWRIDSAHSVAEFKVRHLGVSNVHGTLSKIAGTVKLDDKEIIRSSVDATLDCTTVNTSDADRDTHLKGPDFFDVAKFPVMTFKSSSIARSGDKLRLVGNLMIAGVTKPISLELDGPAPPQTDSKGVTRSGFSATGTIHRSDYNVGSKFPNVVIGDEIIITIDVEIDKQ